MLFLVAATAGCDDEIEPPIQTASPLERIRAFPCDSASNSARDEEDGEVLGQPDQANEVHDCQKLLIDGGNAYGPLVGVYPLPAAEERVPAAFDPGRPVAELFNWGETYEPLGIPPDRSCLWLAWDSATDRWSAGITPAVRDTCAVSASGGIPAEATDLEVQRFTYAEDAPATARWGWGAASGTGADSIQYIGVSCATGWCALGPSGFQPREAAPPTDGGTEVPGWSDEQRLAIPEGDGLVPGPWGRIWPAEGFDMLELEDFGGGPVVAYVELRDGDPGLAHYETTWNFRAPGINTIKLLNRGGHPTEGWYMIVEPPSPAAPDTFTIERVPEVMHAVRGAVRWRWDSEDESSWFGCDLACCTPQGRATF